MDAVEFLNRQPAESVDLLITDPAYESLEKHRAKGTTTRLKVSDGSSNAWFDIFPNSRFPEFFLAVKRALKKDAHFYMLCDADTMFAVKPMAEAAGFKMWTPIIWDKMRLGMGYHYRCRYEFILFFEKGKRRLNDLGIPNVLQVPRVNNGYPTEKPVELLEILVKQSSLPSQVVCDPFSGSGATGVAALRNGRNFLGCDISATAINTAQPRLEQAVSTWTEKTNA